MVIRVPSHGEACGSVVAFVVVHKGVANNNGDQRWITSVSLLVTVDLWWFISCNSRGVVTLFFYFTTRCDDVMVPTTGLLDQV